MNDKTSINVLGACPVPQAGKSVIKLGHGSGGRLTTSLVADHFMKHLHNDISKQLEDAAVVNTSSRIAVTTDCYVVNPIFFPGGNIGSLSVHGTVNDLAVRGARPRFITAGFILEEGFALDDLDTIIQSMSKACEESEVLFIAGDTKVVNRRAGDKIYICTTGIGEVPPEVSLAAANAIAGDAIIVSGDVGRHGMAVMCAREGLDIEHGIVSDSAPIYELIQAALKVCPDVRCFRDITRGGIATVLNEIAEASATGIEVDEKNIPVSNDVAAVCELLGLDPLYVACEGRIVAVVPNERADAVLQSWRQFEVGNQACVVGQMMAGQPPRVVMRSKISGRRILDRLSGEQLPRIC